MSFEVEQITDAKRAVRGLLYKAMQRALRGKVQPRFMVLAGRAPHEEIGTIHALYKDAQVFAFDEDAVAVERARAAGAVVAMCARLEPAANGRLNITDDIPLRFECVHLDLCSNFSTGALELVGAVRRHAGIAYAITLSYGRDEIKWINLVKRVAQDAASLPAQIPVPVRTRAELLTAVINTTGSWSLRSVWSYQGRRMPMATLLFLHHPKGSCNYTRVTDADLDRLFHAHATVAGLEEAARVYNVREGSRI